MRPYTWRALSRRIVALPRAAAAPRQPLPAPPGPPDGGGSGSSAAAPPAEGGRNGAGDGNAGAAVEEEAAGVEDDWRLVEVFVSSALNPSGVLETELRAAAAHQRTAFGSLLFTRSRQLSCLLPPSPLPSVARSPFLPSSIEHEWRGDWKLE